MPNPRSTWTTALMEGLAMACDRHGRWIVAVAVALGVLSSVYTYRCVGFTTDRNEVLQTRDAYHQHYMALKREFGVDDEVVVVVQGLDPSENRRALERLATLLRADREHFTSVLDKIDLEFVRKRILLFLPLDLLHELDKRIRTVMPLLQRVLQRPGLVPLFEALNDQMQTAVHTAIKAMLAGKKPHVDGARTREMGERLPVLQQLLDAMDDSLQGDFIYRSVWMSLLPRTPQVKDLPPLQELPRALYFEHQNGMIYLLLVVPHLDPHSINPTGDAIALLESKVAQVRLAFPAVEFGITGKPAIENDELDIAMEDSMRATVVSFIGVVLLFLFTFKHLLRPAMAMLCLLLALCATMGFTTLVIGRLNILTVNAMPMLVGLGIDFGIQVICRYGEERASGFDPLQAMSNTMIGTGTSIITAGLTTAASFYAAYFTAFKGFQELALMSGTGLIFCLFSMMVVYPSLILMVEKREILRGEGGSARRAAPLTAMTAFERPLLTHPWIVVFTSGVLVVMSLFGIPRLEFDANILHLQARGTHAVEWAQRMEQATGHSLLYAAVVADNVPQARALQRRVEALSVVAEVLSPVMLFPEHEDEKLTIVHRIHKALQGLPPLPGKLPKVDVKHLYEVLQQMRGVLLIVFPEARKAGGNVVSEAVRAFVFSLDLFLQRIPVVDAAAAAERLTGFQNRLFDDLADKIELLQGSNPTQRVTVQDVPLGLRSYMISPRGRILIRVYPREHVWDEAPMKRFIDGVSTVYPDVTGTAMQIYMAILVSRRSCQLAGLYAMIVIVILLLVHFRSVALALLAATPLAVGLAWTGGTLSAFNIDLNPANYLSLPLILGIGVANGVYIVRRCQEENSAAMFTVSTGRAIVLSNLTAIIGFGSLMIARHAGMRSLGFLMSLGVLMCALAALIFLAALLKIFQDEVPGLLVRR